VRHRRFSGMNRGNLQDAVNRQDAKSAKRI